MTRPLRSLLTAAAITLLPVADPVHAASPADGTAALDRVDDLASRYRIALVRGLFSECFEDVARHSGDVQADLRARGFTADYLAVADRRRAIYRCLGAGFQLPGYARGTGDEVLDLHPDTRIASRQNHGDSLQLPFVALVASPQPDGVSPTTRATYKELATTDPRNDGKRLWQEQIPPRTALVETAIAVVAGTRAVSMRHGLPPAADDPGSRQ